MPFTINIDLPTFTFATLLGALLLLVFDSPQDGEMVQEEKETDDDEENPFCDSVINSYWNVSLSTPNKDNDDDEFGAVHVETPASCSGGEEKFVARYKPLRLLGEGTFGRVGLTENGETGEKAVAKYMKLDKCRFKHGEPVEFQVMNLVDHPSICKAVEWYLSSERVVVIMPYNGGIDLKTLQGDGTFSEDFIKEIAIKLVAPIQCLHEYGLVHQDIKPRNILYNEETGEVTLIDFGLAKSYDKTRNRFICTGGSVGFAPPELESKLRVRGPEVDMHSFGATLFYMYYGVYHDDTVDNLTSAYDQRITPYRFKTFLDKCFEYNANRRPKWNDVLESDWLNHCHPIEIPAQSSEITSARTW